MCVHSSDKTTEHLDLINVKHPREVKELIHESVEAAKDQRRMRTMEVMGQGGETDVMDDELPDEPECGN